MLIVLTDFINILCVELIIKELLISALNKNLNGLKYKQVLIERNYFYSP